MAMRERNGEIRRWKTKVGRLCAAAPPQQPKQTGGGGGRDAWGWRVSRCVVITGLKRGKEKRRTWTPGLTECNGRKEGRWVVHVWQWQQRHSSRGVPWGAGGPRRQEERHFYKKKNRETQKEQIKSSLSALTYRKQIIRQTCWWKLQKRTSSLGVTFLSAHVVRIKSFSHFFIYIYIKKKHEKLRNLEFTGKAVMAVKLELVKVLFQWRGHRAESFKGGNVAISLVVVGADSITKSKWLFQSSKPIEMQRV